MLLRVPELWDTRLRPQFRKSRMRCVCPGNFCTNQLVVAQPDPVKHTGNSNKTSTL